MTTYTTEGPKMKFSVIFLVIRQYSEFGFLLFHCTIKKDPKLRKCNFTFPVACKLSCSHNHVSFRTKDNVFASIYNYINAVRIESMIPAALGSTEKYCMI